MKVFFGPALFLFVFATSIYAESSGLARLDGRASGLGANEHSVWLGPPAINAAGQPGRIHRVIKGDTLWDISEAYLGTSWAWPSIWNENLGIENPHRIWPGDRIWISETEMRRVTLAEAEAMIHAAQLAASDSGDSRGPDADGSATRGLDGASRFLRPPDARRVLDTVGFVSPEALAAAASIVDSPEPRIWLAEGDQVYVGLGEGEVAVGDRLSVFRHVEAIRDLRTRSVLGHHVGILGWIEVVEIQGDASVAEVRSSVAEMARGDRVTPQQPWPEPPGVTPVISPAVSGQIVFLPTPRSVMGTLDAVYVDRGSKHGLGPGSALEIIDGGQRMKDFVRGTSVRTPTRVIGELVVLSAQEESALAVVVRAKRELARGDAVRSPRTAEMAGL